MFHKSFMGNLALLLVMCGISSSVSALDFLEKRICVLDLGNNHALVHARCIISGGVQGGTMDVSVRTPDGKIYPLEGPIDGEEGHKFLLQRRPALHSIDDNSEAGNCYARTDGKLKICFGAIDE